MSLIGSENLSRIRNWESNWEWWQAAAQKYIRPMTVIALDKWYVPEMYIDAVTVLTVIVIIIDVSRA